MVDRPNKFDDPTKNVEDLVRALEATIEKLRVADAKYRDDLGAAETRRIDQLAAQKLMFDLELAKILRANQDAAANLLATQLKEVKNDLSDRMSKQEQFRWESGGKTQGVNMIGALIIGTSIVISGALAAAGFVYNVTSHVVTPVVVH
jgi:hypothetical protein